jgi:hypothetical protein
MAKAIESTPRRSSTIAAAIAPAPEPAAQAFEKITMTIPADVREAVALAVVKLKVSESAFYTAGARMLLDAPATVQRDALRGLGKRRKSVAP